jgi:hypothetical protein
MKNNVKLTYDVKVADIDSTKYGFIVTKVKKFKTMKDAAAFSRVLSNNDITLVGKPVIEDVSDDS